MVDPQLLSKRLRRLPQLAADAAQVHGDARVQHIAQLVEDDALRVLVEHRQRRHRGARWGAFPEDLDACYVWEGYITAHEAYGTHTLDALMYQER